LLSLLCFSFRQANSKTKDAQLKRAVETVSRLKTQVTELQQQAQVTLISILSLMRSKADSLEAKVRTLERQRGDLIAAFKKQMKLIDVLKRQKVGSGPARAVYVFFQLDDKQLLVYITICICALHHFFKISVGYCRCISRQRGCWRLQRKSSQRPWTGQSNCRRCRRCRRRVPLTFARENAFRVYRTCWPLQLSAYIHRSVCPNTQCSVVEAVL
jgi:hypothetical protein